MWTLIIDSFIFYCCPGLAFLIITRFILMRRILLSYWCDYSPATLVIRIASFFLLKVLLSSTAWFYFQLQLLFTIRFYFSCVRESFFLCVRESFFCRNKNSLDAANPFQMNLHQLIKNFSLCSNKTSIYGSNSRTRIPK